MEQSRRQSRNTITSRIDEQLQRVERMVLALVDGVDVNEMSSYERLNVTIKLMQQHARLLMMRQTVTLDEPERTESVMLGVLMRQLRGEESGGVESPQIEDAQREGWQGKDAHEGGLYTSGDALLSPGSGE